MKKILLFSSVFLLYSTNYLFAEGIWPFNTPGMEASLICRNAANQAEYAATKRSIMSLSEMLEEYNEPEWRRPEKYLLKREYIRATKMAYQNKNISPKTLKKMMEEDCSARKNELIEEIVRRKKK